MQAQLNKLITEFGLLGAIGAGFFMFKHRPFRMDEFYLQFEHLSKTTVPILLEKFRLLQNTGEFYNLCASINQLLQMADALANEKYVQGGQFRMNRLSDLVSFQAKQMIYIARTSNDMDVVTAAIDCERDELPQLEAFCQNTVRNMLL